ncbi:MAG TPA: winged helix-turn-helix domain-containing protein [Pyrinomonadaceae bacterium]|nr:winged helix-turn-helix domain-containing protein [Pyrinomonadaceae bacterium]
MSNEFNDIRRFEDFRLVVKKKELWYGDDPVDLPEKAIELLIVLTETPGEIIRKEELAARVWGEAPGAESSLTHAIHSIRKAIREKCPDEFIKTVPRRGYRFVADVVGTEGNGLIAAAPADPRWVDEKDLQLQATAASEKPVATLPEGVSAPKGYRRWAAALVIVVAVVIVAGLAARWYQADRPVAGFSNVRSLAVLPLRAVGNEDEILRMRITDSVITRLSEVERIRIRPTAVVQRYMDGQVDPVTAGRELLVDAVFTGSVELKDAILRVELRAISTSTGDQIWSDRFVGEPDRLLALQDIISGRILTLLRTEEAGRGDLVLAQNPTENPEAYENFLTGRYFWQKRTFEGLTKAIEYFEKAIEIDPNFAEAYVGIADSHYLKYDYNYDLSEENVDRAKTFLERAIEIDPENYQAFVTMGLIQTTYEWDWEAAARSFEKAFELSPDLADAFHRRGMLRLKLGDFSAAEADLRRAVELEPASVGVNMNLGVVLYFSGKNQDAMRHFREAIDRDGRLSSPRWYLARCIWQTGDKERAMLAYLEALDNSGSTELADNIRERRKTQAVDEVIKYWLEEWEKTGVSEHSRAILASHIRDSAATLKLLQSAIESKHPWAANINVEPEFAFIRMEPEFKQLLKKLGLPTSAQK